MNKPVPTYPSDHKPGMRIPRGGSMCSNCEYLRDREKRVCGEPNFIRWNGSSVIPAPVEEYCSDWYKPESVPSNPVLKATKLKK